MYRKRFDELTAFMGAVWGRELSQLQRAGGWKLLHALPNEAVEGAISEIADSGLEHLPAWPIVLKTARAIADRQRDALPVLPQGDSLSDNEHTGAMIMLRAKQTDEQNRRADRMTVETKHLGMGFRLQLSKLLMQPWSQLEREPWNKTFDRTLAEFTKAAAP